VVEIDNQSPVPVALAVAIRPYGVAGTTDDRAPDGPLELVGLEVGDRPRVTVDRHPLLWLPRAPNEAGATATRDLFDDVSTGQTLSWGGPTTGRGANAVCLYPLPHRTSLRFAIDSLAERGPAGPQRTVLDVDRLPEPDAAARGWTAVVDRAARFEFPDPGVGGLAGAARARLVMAGADLAAQVVETPAGAGTVLAGLAAGGHGQECRWSLEAVARSFPGRLPTTADDAAELLGALGPAAEVVADDDLTQAVLEVGAQLTHLVERAAGGPVADRAKLGLARLALVAGQPDAAAGLFADLGQVMKSAEPADRALVTGVPERLDLDQLTGLAQQAAPAGRFPGPGLGSFDLGEDPDSAPAAARFWLAARNLLIDEAGPLAGRLEPTGRQTIHLLPEFPSAWLGGPVEVHEAPVAGVRVSFAIRWHGYRPALLWEVAGGDQPVTLRCPGLDPDWSTAEPNGEALLAGSASELPEAPAPGDSFS
jgi:hypothetical protein